MFGFAIPDQGFYSISIPGEVIMNKAGCVIQVLEGEATEGKLQKELKNLVDTKWDWQVREVDEKEFMAIFLNKSSLETFSKISEVGLSIHGLKVRFIKTNIDPDTSSLLQTTWVIYGLPTIARSEQVVRRVTALAGEPLVADELSLMKIGPVRVEMNVKDPAKLRGFVEIFFNKVGYEIRFVSERYRNKASKPPPPPPNRRKHDDDLDEEDQDEDYDFEEFKDNQPKPGGQGNKVQEKGTTSQHHHTNNIALSNEEVLGRLNSGLGFGEIAQKQCEDPQLKGKMQEAVEQNKSDSATSSEGNTSDNSAQLNVESKSPPLKSLMNNYDLVREMLVGTKTNAPETNEEVTRSMGGYILPIMEQEIITDKESNKACDTNLGPQEDELLVHNVEGNYYIRKDKWPLLQTPLEKQAVLSKCDNMDEVQDEMSIGEARNSDSDVSIDQGRSSGTHKITTQVKKKKKVVVATRQSSRIRHNDGISMEEKATRRMSIKNLEITEMENPDEGEQQQGGGDCIKTTAIF